MIFLLAGMIALVLGLYVVSRLRDMAPRDALTSMKWTALGIVACALVMVLVTKNFHFIWGAGAAIIPWISRFQTAGSLWKTLKRFGGEQRSTLSSAYVDISILHSSGQMDGRIKKGKFTGTLLSELSEQECALFLEEVIQGGDPHSVQVAQTYLEKRYGSDWRHHRDGTHSSQSHNKRDMSYEEALDLLGVDRNATEDEIRASHRRLMKQVHPDVGGSPYLASKINQARDVLLG